MEKQRTDMLKTVTIRVHGVCSEGAGKSQEGRISEKSRL